MCALPILVAHESQRALALLFEHTIAREIAEKVVIVRTIEDEAAVVDDIAGKAALGPARAELEITVAFGAHVTLEHAGEHQPAIGDDRAAGVRDIGGIDGEHRLADQPELPRPVDRQIVERRDGFVLAEVRSEEHTSELQSPMRSSYAVFCLKKKNKS